MAVDRTSLMAELRDLNERISDLHDQVFWRRYALASSELRPSPIDPILAQLSGALEELWAVKRQVLAMLEHPRTRQSGATYRTQCTQVGCAASVHKRGLCRGHYRAWDLRRRRSVGQGAHDAA